MTPRGLLARLLSVSVYVKILGIGSALAVLFGGVLLWGMRTELRTIFERTQAQQTRSLAVLLASRVEKALLVRDLYALGEALREFSGSEPDLRYALVVDRHGRLAAHTFAHMPPVALVRDLLDPGGGRRVRLTRWRTASGVVFDAVAPVLGGDAGAVRVGLGDGWVQQELSSSTHLFVLTLALCTVIGLAVAMVLGHLVTRPIEDLVVAAERVGRGDLDHHAPVYHDDEIGTLARAFNRMVSSLNRYRRQLEAKEAARQQLVARVVASQEEERARLARELHDGLGQSLSAALMFVRARRPAPASPDGAAAASEAGAAEPSRHWCDELEARIVALLDEVRRMAWGLRPSVLDDCGLALALERQVSEARALSGIAFDFQHAVSGDDCPRDRLAELVLYRVGQEAINNVVRHAGARRASVILYRRPTDWMLIVEDDGCGFDLEAAERRGAGLGLGGMRQRVALVGGHITIETAPGRGTTLRVVVPVGGRGHAAPDHRGG